MQDKIQIYNEFAKPAVKNARGEAVAFTKISDTHGREILCFDAVPQEIYYIGEA